MKIRLDSMIEPEEHPKAVRIRITSEVTVTTGDLTGLPNKEYDSLEDLVQTVQQEIEKNGFVSSWSEVMSNLEIWHENNWIDFDIEWE